LSVITLTIFITWPVLFFLTKRYAVVKTEWAFSKTDERTGQLIFASVSERQWLDRWARVIEQAVMRQNQVTLTQEDLARNESGSEPFPSEDSAAYAAGANMGVYREVNRQLGWGEDS
jgi:hypothetical protein